MLTIAQYKFEYYSKLKIAKFRRPKYLNTKTDLCYAKDAFGTVTAQTSATVTKRASNAVPIIQSILSNRAQKPPYVSTVA